MTEWDREKQDLLTYHDQLRGRAAALEAEIRSLLNSFEVDTALVRARRTLEVIAIELCEQILHRSRGTEPLDGLISRFADALPEEVLVSMRNLNRLGNMGAHPKSVTGRDVRQAFLALTTVLHWYVVEYKATPSASPADAAPTLNPYRGLDAFEEKDADRFFGREHYLESELWPAFQALDQAPARLLALVGPSGSGKSSLARAGLLPLLKQNLPACRLLVIVPGHHPLEALARALAQHASPDDLLPAGKAQEFLELLERGDGQGLRRIVDMLHMVDGAPRVLLVDQFEETFTLCKEPAQQRLYLTNLLNAVSGPAARFTLLLTLRSDFLAETQSHPAFNQALSRLAHLVPVLDDDGLRRAITEPARRAGRPLDDAVTQLLMEQSAGREGALPLLQYALTEIWRGLEQGQAAADTLAKIGGVGGALAGRAQAVYGQLQASEQAVARRAFLKLVQLGEGGQDTRRRVALDDLVAEGESRAAVHAILHRFAAHDARFLTFGQDAGQDSVAITHDALIQHWQALRGWLNANRDDLRLLNRLDGAAKHWQAARRPRGLLWRRPDLDLLKKLADDCGREFTATQAAFHRAAVREERRTTWLKRAAMLSLVLLTVTALWLISQKQKADQQKEQATQNFSRMQRALNEFYILIGENKLLNTPGMEGLRRDLQENALKFYRELSSQHSDDPAMQEAIAAAAFRVGVIRQNLGDSAGTPQAYRDAITKYEALAREHPKFPQYSNSLASSYNSLGNQQRILGDFSGAEVSYMKALQIRERLVIENPEVAEYLKNLAASYNNLGNLRQGIGDIPDAQSSYQKALEILNRLVLEHPNVSANLSALATSHNNLGGLLDDSGKFSDARASYQKALEIRERLLREHPDVPEYLSDLASSHYNLGLLQQASGDIPGARASWQNALEIFERLERENPKLPEYINNIAMVHSNMGNLQSDSNDIPGARTSYQKALKIRERLVREYPDVLEYFNDLAKSHGNLGNLQKVSGDIPGARVSMQKALAIFERLAQAHPDIPEYRANADKAKNQLAGLERPAVSAKPR